MPTNYASYSLYLLHQFFPSPSPWKPSTWGPFLWFCSYSSCLLRFCFLFLNSFKKLCIFKVYFIDYAITIFPISPPLSSLHPATLQHSPLLSSCPWVVHISSLSPPFPIPFFISPHLFYAYQLCFLFPIPPPLFLPPSSPLKTLHVMFISLILFPVSYTHLTLPTIVEWCRSRWSPYH